MNKHEKEIVQFQLDEEAAVLAELKKQYKKALSDIDDELARLLGRNDANLQNVIYRIEHQKALRAQVAAVLEQLHTKEFNTISGFLTESYTNGFVGTMYSFHKHGIPLLLPIDPKNVVKAVTTDSKLKGGLYDALGIDIKKMKKSISAEISRGIASGMSYNEITRNISRATGAPLSRAKTIVQTESHRIEQASSYEAASAAKKRGADTVKIWNATLDGATRPTHRELDGQIREIDEPFEAHGMKAMYPGDFGDPAEDCNCRCLLLTMPRWALDEDELKTLQERAAYFGLDKSENFKEFRAKYLETVDKIPESGIIKVNSGVSRAIGEDHSQAIRRQIQKSPENIKAVWDDCADDYNVIDAHHPGTAHYDPTKGGVFVDIDEAAKGNPYSAPYQYLHHELGHNTDYLLNIKYGSGDNRKAFSETYKNGLLGKTLKDEANKIIDDYATQHNIFKVKGIDFNALQAEANRLVQAGSIKPHEMGSWMSKALDDAVRNAKTIDRVSAETAFCEHIKRTLSPMQRGNISDMFEPVMHAKNEKPFGTGHGATYWWHRDNGKEAFAHMYSASITNPESLEQIKRFFPESFKIFEKMLEAAK